MAQHEWAEHDVWSLKGWTMFIKYAMKSTPYAILNPSNQALCWKFLFVIRNFLCKLMWIWSKIREMTSPQITTLRNSYRWQEEFLTRLVLELLERHSYHRARSWSLALSSSNIFLLPTCSLSFLQLQHLPPPTFVLRIKLNPPSV